MLQKRLTYLLILLTASFRVQAQEHIHIQATAEKLDKFLSTANSFYQFNGTVIVSQKNKILLSKGYGYRNVARKLPNTENTIYQIGSITKGFTSTMILSLSEQGKLAISDPVSRHLPEYPELSKITVEHLLSHTSGLRNYTSDLERSDSAIICHPVPRKQVLEHFIGHQLEFKPGLKYNYCNSGYYLLGMIIEKITGKSFEDNIRSTIFKPLEMSSSGFDFKASEINMRAQGYQFYNADHIQPDILWDSTITYAAGGIYATPLDLMKWAKSVSDGQILKKSSWTQAFPPRLHNYGLGWESSSLSGRKFVSHNGGFPGFSSQLMIFPEEDLQIVILSNVQEKTTVTPIAHTLAKICLSQPYVDLAARSDFQDWTGDSFNEIAGVYELDQEHSLEITAKGDQLYIQSASNKLPLTRLVPIDSQTAILADVFSDLKVLLPRDDSGKRNKIDIVQKGKTYTWKRKNNLPEGTKSR